MGLRIAVDKSNESVGKKIRAAEVMKIPVSVVIGQKELETGKLTPRVRKDLADGNEPTEQTIEDFLQTIAKEVSVRR